jgi:general secretion pathway protein D
MIPRNAMSTVKPSRARALTTLCALALTLALGACGSAGRFREADKLFEQGQYVEATQRYRAVADAEPKNVRYQQTFLLRRREALDTLFRNAERERQSGNLSAAESLYQTALQVEPGNASAQEWLRRLGDMRRHGEQLVKADELIAAGKLGPAETIVRAVLAEAPENLRAQNSLERIRAAVATQHASDPDNLDARFAKPVTLEFRDVPVRVAFDVLGKASGINFVYDQDVRPDLKVSVFLRKTPLDEAIRMIGLSTQLETRVLNANSILVYPNTPQKVSDYRQLSVRSFYLQNADAKKVAETLKAILKAETVVVDEKLNLLVIRDTPEAIRLAEKLIALQDIGEPEVMLDVEVLEIKRAHMVDMGIGLPNEIGLSVGPTGNGQTPGLTLEGLHGLGASGIGVTIPTTTVKLHDESSDARILANPKIRVKSKEKASVLIGDKVPVITSTSTSTGFLSESVNYVDVGLKLEVEPSVYSGDEVSIKINLEVSNLVREIRSQGGTLSYQIGTRNAQTVLRLKDGETQILAGLINEEDRKLGNGWPGLARFPVLDRIFGTRKSDKQNTEIVLSITPHLIRGVHRADLDEMEFESGTATNLRAGRATAAADHDAGSDEAATDATDAPAAEGALPTVDVGSGPIAPVVPSGAPAAPAAPPAAGSTQTLLFDWSAPPEVRVGEQFTAVLNLSALHAIEQLPVLIGFDPKVLQVVSVEEGTFMAQGGGRSTFSQQVNLSDGKLTATAVREGTAVSGQGSLLQVTFKALTPAESTQLRLLSASPAPAEAGVARLAEVAIRIR